MIESYKNRRTFCIVSHPDAGKTTLTEKFLLFGGAIREAGTVKARKAARYATSDWMEIEKQRGISVTSSVMQFDFDGHRINLLDTPGHHDFSEDTYRVITAVDSALMVVDGAKGIEPQTKKLMRICSERHIPVITFINKFDRECKNPLELLDEIESVLGVKTSAFSLPVSSGKNFRGIYNLHHKSFSKFEHNAEVISRTKVSGVEDPQLRVLIGEDNFSDFEESMELLSDSHDEFSREKFLNGQLTPVFFGSALNNFGVQDVLECFCDLAPAPQPRISAERIVEPQENKFSGVVFKIQANMDSRHRDRIAFLRVCSGVFKKGMSVFHSRLGRQIKISNTFQFMSSKRESIEEAYAGDIIGIYDTGDLKIGDSLTEKEKLSFLGIPNFAPELFQKVLLKSPLKSKQLHKGLQQLCEEGTSQVFYPSTSNDIIIGVVGQLQFEVIRYRLENEYGAESKFESCAFRLARWVFPKPGSGIKDFQKDIAELGRSYDTVLARDAEERYAILCSSNYALEKAAERYPSLLFTDVSEVTDRVA